jgi:predicted RNA-binding protein with PUA-like domain
MSERSYWLMKSEPDVFGIQDLANSPYQTTAWEGVRNNQARNYMRDSMKPGDGVLFYHSNANPLCVAGTAVVASEAVPDPTQFDPESEYFDATSSMANPRWMMRHIKLVHLFEPPVLRETLAATPGLESMILLQRGTRLSVHPVTADEWRIIHHLAGVQPT